MVNKILTNYSCIFSLLTLCECIVDTIDQTNFYKKYVPDINYSIESGYVRIDHGGWIGNMFYQLVFQQETNPLNVKNNSPVIFWIDGGPGCGSQSGLYDQLGPFEVIKEKTEYIFNKRKTSWNEFANLVFVDQPYGVGLSYCNATFQVNTTDLCAQYFSQFMVEFFQSHPYFFKNPIYLWGESYAGHYIPAMTVELINNQQWKALNTNLIGIGIGDGWTDPLNQISFYSSYLYTAGLVDNLRRDEVMKMQTASQTSILQQNYALAQIEFDEISGDTTGSYFAKITGGLDPYNIQDTDYDANEELISESFMNQNKQQLGVPQNVNYKDCDEKVYEIFGGDIAESRVTDMIQVLESGLQVLLYNGNLDYMVNTAGALNWINQMKWSQNQQWKQANKQFFKFEDEVVGWLKRYNNFIFVSIYKAGHLSIIDQPEITKEMVLHFINQDYIWE